MPLPLPVTCPVWYAGRANNALKPPPLPDHAVSDRTCNAVFTARVVPPHATHAGTQAGKDTMPASLPSSPDAQKTAQDVAADASNDWKAAASDAVTAFSGRPQEMDTTSLAAVAACMAS